MKPDWDKLAKEFDSSNTVLIADVDCTVEKALCSTYGVRGYPTLKYFSGSTGPEGEKYEGARDLKSLKKFASENLGPSCSNDNIDLCNDEQKAILAEANAMSASERKTWIASQVKIIDDAEKTFKSTVEGLQASYQAAMTAKDDAMAAVQPKLSLFRTVKESSTGHDEL